MGLFGKKTAATSTVTTPAREGWMSECGPLCGFVVKDHEKNEAAQIVTLHMKQTHKTNLTQAEALSNLTPTAL